MYLKIQYTINALIPSSYNYPLPRNILTQLPYIQQPTSKQGSQGTLIIPVFHMLDTIIPNRGTRTKSSNPILFHVLD